MVLNLEKNELYETIDTTEVSIKSHENIDVEHLKKLVFDNDNESEVVNEHLGEILETGKHFDFQYELDKKSYREFIKKYTPRDWFLHEQKDNIVTILNFLNRNDTVYVSVSLEFREKYDEEYNRRLAAVLSVDVDVSEDLPTDYFCIDFMVEEDCKKLIEFLNDAAGFLGKPNLREKQKKTEYYLKDLKNIIKSIENLNKI